MKNLIVTFLFVLTLSLKESESGINDWNRINIGEVKDIHFCNVKTTRKGSMGVKKPNMFFFES